jgi:hypothetical protein
VDAGGGKRLETWQCSPREAQPHPWPVGENQTSTQLEVIPTPQVQMSVL